MLPPVRRTALLTLIPMLLAGLLVGCGGAGEPTAEITGTITLDRKPPKVPGRLEIAFVDRTGKMIVAPVAEDGTYTAAGVAAGEVNVYFIYIGREALDAASRGVARRPVREAKQPQGQEVVPDVPNPVPLRMREALTSGLSLTARADRMNVFAFDIPPP